MSAAKKAPLKILEETRKWARFELIGDRKEVAKAKRRADPSPSSSSERPEKRRKSSAPGSGQGQGQGDPSSDCGSRGRKLSPARPPPESPEDGHPSEEVTSECSICLTEMEEEKKAFAERCFHSFCRTCLIDWSKIKSECPVCRQPFERVIYNVKAIDDYEEYLVPKIEVPHDRQLRSVLQQLLTTLRESPRQHEAIIEILRSNREIMEHIMRRRREQQAHLLRATAQQSNHQLLNSNAIRQESVGISDEMNVVTGVAVSEDMEVMASTSSSSPGASGESRRLSIERCIADLVHACHCPEGLDCPLPGCSKMKRVVQHSRRCRRRSGSSGTSGASQGCPICKQFIALCCYHAKSCLHETCPIPYCRSIKQKLRQQLELRSQQRSLTIPVRGEPTPLG